MTIKFKFNFMVKIQFFVLKSKLFKISPLKNDLIEFF